MLSRDNRSFPGRQRVLLVVNYRTSNPSNSLRTGTGGLPSNRKIFFSFESSVSGVIFHGSSNFQMSRIPARPGAALARILNRIFPKVEHRSD